MAECVGVRGEFYGFTRIRPSYLPTHPDRVVMGMMTGSTLVNRKSLVFERRNHGLAD